MEEAEVCCWTRTADRLWQSRGTSRREAQLEARRREVSGELTAAHHHDRVELEAGSAELVEWKYDPLH